MYRLSINLIAVGAVVYRIYVYTYTYIYTHTHISYEQTRIRIHNSVSAYVSFVRSRRRLYIISSLNDSATGLSKGFSEGGGGSIKCGYRQRMHMTDASLAFFLLPARKLFLTPVPWKTVPEETRQDRSRNIAQGIHTHIHTYTYENTKQCICKLIYWLFFDGTR